jgi:hypothetical protein
MDLTCGWIADPNDSYNCNRCGADVEFCEPYLVGDLIMLQTQLPDLVSATATVPTAGWFPTTAPAAYRAQLLDVDGNVISSDVTTFTSDYMAAYAEAEGGFSYQTLVIDTQAIFNTYGLSCFSIRVNSFESNGTTENRVVYSECFSEETCGDDTVLVSGDWDSTDCCGNYYGDPARSGASFIGSTLIRYNNQRRYYAKVVQSSANITKTTFNKRVTKSEINSIYDFILDRPVSPWMFNVFSKLHYGAKIVTIDGTEYVASGTIDNRISNKSGTMFLFDAELQIECDTDFNCI